MNRIHCLIYRTGNLAKCIFGRLGQSSTLIDHFGSKFHGLNSSLGLILNFVDQGHDLNCGISGLFSECPDFIGDQFSVVEEIYGALGLDMTGEAADAMKAFIDDNPPGKHGVHFYEPHEFGIEPDHVREQFADYIAHFDLTPE